MNVIALDFDGVLCDSAAETGVTGWRAGRRYWPEWRDPEPPAPWLQRFVEFRPLLETGYQAILLMRLAALGVPGETVAARFRELCRELVAELGVTVDELVAQFGKTRDRWIRDDLDDWLGRHRFYPGTLAKVADAMRRDAVFITTTKQKRFALALLEAGGVTIREDRVFGLEAARAKETILGELLERPEFQGASWHFVEDRLKTLLRVAAVPELERVRLYLAEWGYTSADARRAARQHPRITVWELPRFLEFDGA